MTIAAGPLEEAALTRAAIATTFDVKPGDANLFGKYASQEIKRDGEEFLIIREDEVLAVVETS